MNTFVMKSAVLAALKVALKLADRKSTMPQLNRLRVSADGTTLSIRATDLDTWVDATVACQGDTLPEFTVDARRFVQAVDECAKRRRGRGSPDKEITLSLDGTTLTVSGDATYTLAVTPTTDYPTLKGYTFDATAQVAYNGATLADSLAFVAPAVCQDETRFHLNGVLFAADGNLVATDGHRLHKVNGLPACPRDAIVASRTVTILRAALKAFEPETVTADFTSVGVRFQVGCLTIQAKLIDSQYPPYQCVIPRSSDGKFIVDRKAGSVACKSANRLCSETRGMVLTSCQAGVVMSVKCDDGSEMRQTVPATHFGTDLAFGVNARYLAEAFDGMGSESVRVEGQGALDPFTIEDGAKLAVIMPMRV